WPCPDKGGRVMTPRQVLNKLYPRPTKQPKGTSPSQHMIQEMLGPLVQGLTDPDEPRRQSAVRHVQQTCVPAVITPLIDRLGDLLGGSGIVQRQAVASLAGFWPRALPALTLRFSGSRSVVVQQGIVAVFAAVARGLDRDGRLGLMTELLILSRRAA